MVILNHFRRKLKLGVFGRVTSYLPVVAMPAGLAALYHTMVIKINRFNHFLLHTKCFKQVIQRNLVLSKYDCPLCLQTKAIFIQTGIGLVYPLLLAPMASFMYATRHFTYRMPYLTEQPKAWLKLWVKLTRSAKGISFYLLLANVIAAAAVTGLEMSEYYDLQVKMEEHEKKVESGFFDEEK